MFLTQDVTDGGAPDPKAQLWCPDADPLDPLLANRKKAAALVTAPVNTAPHDLMLVTAHSLLDVGPVILGDGVTNGKGGLRPAPTKIFRPRIWAQGRKAYRSLHRRVTFRPVGGDGNCSVPIQHRLHTGDVQVFATPSLVPIDGTAAVKIGWSMGPDPDTVLLTVSREDNGAFSANLTFTYDVMVVSQPPVGHSIVYHDNRSYTLPSGLPIAGAPVSKRPDYRACYVGPASSAEPGSLPGGAVPVVHNDRKNASMLLLGSVLKTPSTGPGLSVPYIVSRAYGGPPYVANRTSVINDTLVNSEQVTDILVVTPHSILTSRVVPPPPPT